MKCPKCGSEMEELDSNKKQTIGVVAGAAVGLATLGVGGAIAGGLIGKKIGKKKDQGVKSGKHLCKHCGCEVKE